MLTTNIELLDKIRDAYQSCSESERACLIRILTEFSQYGYSDTYDNIWMADYKEIPVSIDTFIRHPAYLGKATRNGEAIYPAWWEAYHSIFNNGNKYDEVILTGATRIGKTSTGITGTAYMLYRLMCLRDPQSFFNKKDVSKFSILFFNVTKDLAKGVAFREFNDTLRISPWFCERGSFSRSEQNFYYIPNDGKITIDYGSDASHGLGKQVYCLVGDTKVLTNCGWVEIASLSGQYHDIGQLNKDGSIIYSNAKVQLTNYVSETIRVELEDGTILEGTYDHPVMLSDGSYKKLGELTNLDDVLTFNISEVDHMNLKDANAKFTVYMHVSPNGKVYVGITSKPVTVRWGTGGKEYKCNEHFWNAIQKYGWDNFEHRIVATGLSLIDACDMEVSLIAEYKSDDQSFGYNHTSGGNWCSPSEEIREKLRAATSANWQNPEFRDKVVRGLTGHPVSQATREKISKSNLGKPGPIHPWKGKRMPEEHRLKCLGHVPWNSGKTKESDSRIARYSEKLSGRVRSGTHVLHISESRRSQYDNGYRPIWITDGNIETTIDASCQDVPPGFHAGRLSGHYKYMYNSEKCIRVRLDAVSDFQKNGWKLGRGECIGVSIQKAKLKFVYFVDDNMFETSRDAAEFLKSNGYPDISQTTVENISRNKLPTKSKYTSLIGRICRKER